jgi:hypothetical protein
MPSQHSLATSAILASVLVMFAVLVAYPIAARRVMRAEVEGAGGYGRPGVWRGAMATSVRALARAPATLAAIQFLSATAFRVSSHRFIVAIGITLDGWVGVPCQRLENSPDLPTGSDGNPI